MIWGIDIGTATGWAVLDEDGEIVESGRWDLGRSTTYPCEWPRYQALRSRLLALEVQHGPPRLIGYELVRRHMGTQAAHIYGGLRSVLLGVADELGATPVPLPVSAPKIIATGKGNANKRRMIDAARRLCSTVGSHDEADAIYIALATLAHERRE